MCRKEIVSAHFSGKPTIHPLGGLPGEAIGDHGGSAELELCSPNVLAMPDRTDFAALPGRVHRREGHATSGVVGPSWSASAGGSITGSSAVA